MVCCFDSEGSYYTRLHVKNADNTPDLIGPLLGTTPVSRARRRSLPDDLMRDASRRLGILSLLAAVLWVVSPLLDHLAARATASPGDTRWARLDVTDAIAGVSAFLSITVYLYTRKRGKDARLILDLGLVTMVLNALALSLMSHWSGLPSNMPIFPMISWVGVVVLMFAAFVPNSPMRTLVAGLIAVSMNPLAMLIARARGMWAGPASNVLVMHYPDYLLLGVAVVISHVVTRLGQQVTKEREMGSYQLGALLGRGGMGEVYRATHRMLARPAAIKLIRPEMLGGGDGEGAQVAATRFRREAEAAANLRSPHTVELYDFGVTADGTLYIVMEFLEGMDLESIVRNKGPLPAARVIHILRQVCESLEEAHASGLIHRDIKPANIHIGRLGLRQDFVKVLDFGLVKSVADTSPEASIATAEGLTPGTPAYLPPEAALGETIDGRADLYALGCVAYYLLTGHLVFESSNPMEMIARHMRDQPVPPSKRTDLPVPPELERLVLACLEKNPNDRPRSAADLGRALGAIPVEPWSEEQATEWWSLHRPV
jgi:eukaryotic-like serine/threonine-protein kinase